MGRDVTGGDPCRDVRRPARVPVDRTSILAVILDAPPTRARNTTDTPAEHPRALGGLIGSIPRHVRTRSGPLRSLIYRPACAGRRSWHLSGLVRLGGCPGVEGPFPSAGLDEQHQV